MRAAGTSHRARTRAWAPWVVLTVVVGVAFGVGARPGSNATAAQRVAAIDAGVRCPSCEDISVADSSAATAVAIRRLVAARVRAGESDTQIDAFLISRYGPGIVLRPPMSGITAAVWVVPLVAMAVAGGGLVLVFWRRRRLEAVDVPAEDRALVARALAEEAGKGHARGAQAASTP